MTNLNSEIFQLEASLTNARTALTRIWRTFDMTEDEIALALEANFAVLEESLDAIREARALQTSP